MRYFCRPPGLFSPFDHDDEHDDHDHEHDDHDHGDHGDNDSSYKELSTDMNLTWKSTPRVELRFDMKTPFVILQKIMVIIMMMVMMLLMLMLLLMMMTGMTMHICDLYGLLLIPVDERRLANSGISRKNNLS